MGIASGIGSQVGVAPEATYGTYVAPSRFLQADKVSLKKVKNTAQSNGFAAGRLAPLASGRVVTTRAAAGSIDHEVLNSGMGLLVQALMGTSVTPVQQGATTAYLQTHILANTMGKSLTIQAGVPNTSGVVVPYTYLGCKVTGGQFTFDIGKETTAQWTIDAQDVADSQTLAAASYSTNTRPFVGTDMSVKIGATYGSEAPVTGVTKAVVKFDRGHNTNRYYFGAGGVKAEPIINAWPKITGTLSADFVDKTVFADRFAADTMFYLVCESVGPVISGTYYNTFRITLPGCFLDGDTPMADTLDVINGQFPFTWLFDGTNLPKIEIISTDTTL